MTEFQLNAWLQDHNVSSLTEYLKEQLADVIHFWDLSVSLDNDETGYVIKLVIHLDIAGSGQEDIVEILRTVFDPTLLDTDLSLDIEVYQNSPDIPSWQQQIKLEPSSSLMTTDAQNSQKRFGKLWDKLGNSLQTSVQFIGHTTTQVGQAVGQAATTTGSVLGTVTGQASQVVLNTATATGKGLGHTATHVSQQTVQVTASAGTAVANAVVQTSKVVSETAVTVGGAVGQVTSTATTSAGQMANWVSKNPLFKPVTKTLQMDWLVDLLDQVDVDKAEGVVRKLRSKYPNESPGQIAHRLMLKKVTLAAGTGLASSALPGFVAALLVLDFSFTMSLQAEMVYQIAAAYGLDLNDPARKGEVLAIFGLSVGGSKAIQGGVKYATQAGIMSFLKNVPAAGAVIGSSTNAAMTYSLGYAACRFYEAKVNPLVSQEVLTASENASEHYLQAAMTQEVVMDQILLHVVDSSNPNQSWQEVLPDLKHVGLSPVSLESLEEHKNALPPLETLLKQIDPDFAIPLMSQCQKIATMDGVITPEEKKILQQITETFQVDLEALQQDGD